MTEEEWIKKIKVHEAKAATAEEWETEATQPTQQAQPTVINNYFIQVTDNSVNVQSVITAAAIPVNMVDDRPRLTKEKRALLGPWQEYAGYTG